MKKLFLTAVMSLLMIGYGFSQQYLEKSLKTYNNPDELVTLSANISFNHAIDLLSKVSEKITGKKIVSSVSIDTSIGIEIKNMNYYKAMVVLVKMAGLKFEERPDVIVIKHDTGPETKRTKDNYVPVNAREVNISAVFFEEDVNKSRERGLDWQTLFEKEGLTIGTQMGNPNSSTSGSNTGSSSSSSSSSGSSSNQKNIDFNITGTSNFNLGGFFGKATAIFRFFENNNLGEIISSPNITVLDGTQAKLQDGQDLAIKQRDFSGNIIENFYSIGSIVTVTPHVLSEDGVNYILLNIHVERSSFVPDPNNTIINKTAADTRVVMLNGEETVIGGMFINQTSTVRSGIPFLKDLPWWFFGLRYIFGSDQNIVTKKELVILLRAELVPTLKERLAGPQSTSPLKDELNKQREKIKLYEFKQNKSDNNDNN